MTVILLDDEPSKAVAPVLARLWFFCCSLSEGERDLLRVDSASGMFEFSPRVLLLAFVFLNGLKWVWGAEGLGETREWSDGDGRRGCEGSARMEDGETYKPAGHTSRFGTRAGD